MNKVFARPQKPRQLPRIISGYDGVISPHEVGPNWDGRPSVVIAEGDDGNGESSWYPWEIHVSVEKGRDGEWLAVRQKIGGWPGGYNNPTQLGFDSKEEAIAKAREWIMEEVAD